MLGIIMAGGQGSRLMPLTATRPKPMVEVLGRPVIDYVKEAMMKAGIDEIIVTTGYRGEQLKSHVASWSIQDEGCKGLKSRISQEATPMGTAGSVGLLRDVVNSTCVVGSGDAVASFDIVALLAAHRRSKAKVTMALFEVENPSEFGIVGLAKTADGDVDGGLREGFIRRFLEKPAPEEAFSNVINAGLYILEPEVFEHIPFGEKFDFSKQLFPKLLELGWPMYAQTIDGVWFDVGQPSELINAQATLIQRYDELPFTYPEGYDVVDRVLHSMDAQMDGDVIRSVIGRDCVVEVGGRVEDSLLMANCVIKSGGNVLNSVIGEGVTVPPGTTLEGCVVGDGATVKKGVHFVDKKIPKNISL